MMKRNFPIFNGNIGYVFSAQPNDKRLYPSGDLARQTIGRSDTIVVGGVKKAGYGLEGMYNEDLAGKDSPRFLDPCGR